MSTATSAVAAGNVPPRRPPRGRRVLRRIGVHLLRLVVITFRILSLLFLGLRFFFFIAHDCSPVESGSLVGRVSQPLQFAHHAVEFLSQGNEFLSRARRHRGRVALRREGAKSLFARACFFASSCKKV